MTTDEETQTAEESPADNETSEEAKEKETHSVEVIINGTTSHADRKRVLYVCGSL